MITHNEEIAQMADRIIRIKEDGSDRLPELTGGGYDECQKSKMYSKTQLKISLCEPSSQSDRHFCHCADNAAIYVHVHHCLVVERQL